jgi:hypothetical protein
MIPSRIRGALGAVVVFAAIAACSSGKAATTTTSKPVTTTSSPVATVPSAGSVIAGSPWANAASLATEWNVFAKAAVTAGKPDVKIPADALQPKPTLTAGLNAFGYQVDPSVVIGGVTEASTGAITGVMALVDPDSNLSPVAIVSMIGLTDDAAIDPIGKVFQPTVADRKVGARNYTVVGNYGYLTRVVQGSAEGKTLVVLTIASGAIPASDVDATHQAIIAAVGKAMYG